MRVLIPFLLLFWFTNPDNILQNEYKQNTKTEINYQLKMSDYDEMWKKVQEFENKGKTLDALTLAEEIYNKATKEKKGQQVVKSLLHIMKYKQVMEENADSLNMIRISEEISKADFPIKQIFQSIQASMYWDYYSQVRWQIYSRTRTENFENKDFKTWDVTRLRDEIQHLYLASVKDNEALSKIPVGEYAEILTRGNAKESEKYRPSLYDLLAHRSLDFFINPEMDVTKPVNPFIIDTEKGFAEAKDFINFRFETQDTLSPELHTAHIFQYLLKTHINNPDCFIDAEIKRLEWAKHKASGANKDTLYKQTLYKIARQYPEHSAVADVWAEIAEGHVTLGTKYNPETEPTRKLEYVKAMDICERMIQKFPEARGTNRCKDIKNGILKKSVGLIIEDVSVPDEKSRMKIDYRNAFQWYFRIIPYDEAIEARMDKEYDAAQRIQILVAQAPINQWKVNLPVETDYQNHSTELIIPETASGKYWLVASDNPDFSIAEHVVSYTDWNVCSFAFYTAKNPKMNEVEYFVTNRKTGKPLSGVQVKWIGKYYDYATYKEKKVIKEATTNVNGVAKIGFPDMGSGYLNYSVELSYGKEKYSSDNEHHYTNREDQGQSYIVFFTDRKIYRPGQTVYFKGICLKTKNGKSDIIPEYHTNIIFRDVNHQEITRLSVTANEYGTFSGTFTAPTSGLMGRMTILDEKTGGATDISVEEYKRPKFEVTFKPVEGSFRLEEKITTKGNAMGYAGNAIDGAEVKYRVVRNASFPYWGYYYWWRPAPASPQMEIANGTTKTDVDGNFSIVFNATPDAMLDKSTKPQFSYTVYADVVDITGETHSATQSVNVGYISMKVTMNLPEKIKKTVPDSVSISTENLNGVFEPAKGSIEFYSLEMPKQWHKKRRWSNPDIFTISEKEFRKWFPYDPYQNEGDYRSWKKKNKVHTLNFNTEKSKKYGLDFLQNQAQGMYMAELITVDKFGNETRILKYFEVEDIKETSPSVPVALALLSDKSSVEPGENVTFTLSSSENSLYTVFTIEQNGIVLERQYLTLNNEKKNIVFPITEKHRGNISAYVTAVVQNEYHYEATTVGVPWTNKNLKLSWMTFRNKLLPGAKEEWSVKITGTGSEKAAAEMVATMYDASLDQFRPNSWRLSGLNPTYNSALVLSGYQGFQTKRPSGYEVNWNNYSHFYNPTEYDKLNFFGYYFNIYRNKGNYAFARAQTMAGSPAPTVAAPKKMSAKPAEESMGNGLDKMVIIEDEKDAKDGDQTAEDGKLEEGQSPKKEIQIRKNLQETAFFFPHLKTNDKGEVIFSFTMPEALTKWKFMGLAHTKDLKTGMLLDEVVTQKDLMVLPNPPRFMRVGDIFEFSSKISNLSDKSLSGTAELIIKDALTGKVITSTLVTDKPSLPFSAEAKQSTLVSWKINVPEEIQAIVYQVVASSGTFSDGEENAIPVVLNKMLVTESIALWVRGGTSKTFILPNLVNSTGSKTLKNQQYTLEFTANPAWYAVQSLPYLMEYPHECTEQLFSRYYANRLASHIGNATPRIRQVFEQWKNAQGGNKEALLSNLAKNQELKSAILEETPWVLNANDETERKKRVALLFDLNRMAEETDRAEKKLSERQNGNGSFTWFPGMKDDRYITQLIVTGFGHMDKLGVKPSVVAQKMTEKAIPYLDKQMKEDYDWLKRNKADMNKNNLGYHTIQYLYMRSFFPEIKVSDNCEEAYQYYWGQAKKYAFENGIYMKGMLALILHRGKQTTIAKELITSIAQNAVHNEEMGMYWKETAGWSWWQSNIEMQSLLIEAFNEVSNDQSSVEEMKVWLLKNKQTNDWKTTRATVEACNALLLTGDNWLENTETPEITIGNKPFRLADYPEIQAEAGTGYFKTSWQGNEIMPDFGKVTVSKKEKGIAWGGIFWQYFEQLDKIKYAETPLSIRKQVFVERPSASGPVIEPISSGTKIKQGDKVKIRIEIRTDREMEYVHLKDMRAAGFEPIEVISSYRYQDGLGYYQSTRDLGTHFFMDYLPKGTYVFEYTLRATHKGDFSNGITTMQCMYAPEFTSHSEGIRVKVE